MKGGNKEIIFVVQYLTYGGAERVAAELITEWVRRGCKITVVQLFPDEFSNSHAMPDGIEYINFDLGKNKYVKLIRGVRGLVRVMKQYPNATVIGFVNRAIIVVGIASLFTNNRIVLSERNNPYLSPTPYIRRLLRDWSFGRADACVFQTPDARDYFSDTVRKKGTIIPNPINPTLPERYEGEREKIIVAAGRLALQKNFPMLIKAFALLHNDFPEYKLVIYGRGSREDELRQLTKTLGVERSVEFPGFSDNIFEDMLRSAVYVSSSDHEGISNSMLEALAMGIPSVVTDCPIGGARMVVKDGVNGILVPVGDVQAMSEGIRKILTDQDFAESIGKEAYRIRNEFPVDKIADRWLEVI